MTDVSTTCAEAILTLKMASAQVVETSVTNNSPSQDSYHPDDLFQSRYIKIMLVLRQQGVSLKFNSLIASCVCLFPFDCHEHIVLLEYYSQLKLDIIKGQ